MIDSPSESRRSYRQCRLGTNETTLHTPEIHNIWHANTAYISLKGEGVFVGSHPLDIFVSLSSPIPGRAMWEYLSFQACHLHGWPWGVLAAENKKASLPLRTRFNYIVGLSVTGSEKVDNC
jgi:hypothetical protein